MVYHMISKGLVSAFALGVWHLAHAASCANENLAITPTTPSTAFTIHSGGTATHDPLGLTWMRCSLGQVWDSQGSCVGDGTRYTWQEALIIAENYEFGGQSDWRLPNKNELASIVEERCYGPAINTTIFPDTPSGWFWSSSTYARHGDWQWRGYAWKVSSYYGYVGIAGVDGNKNGLHFVRLVRDNSQKE